MSVPANVVYFVGYEHLKDSIPSTEYAPLMAGAVARTIAVTMISPIELFRTRLQASVGTEGFRCKFSYSSICQVIKQICRCLRRRERNGCERWSKSTMERITTYLMERCAFLCYLLDGL